VRNPVWFIVPLLPIALILAGGYVLVRHTQFTGVVSTHDLKKAADAVAPVIFGNRIDLPNGCVSGGLVSPTSMTTFYPYDDARELKATPFDVFEVEKHKDVTPHDGRCPVKYARRGDEPNAYGELALADIAPSKDVATAIQARPYNNPDHMTQAEFPQKLRAAIAQRASAFGANPADYESLVTEIVHLIALCTKPEADSALIEQRFLSDIKARRTNTDPYRQCEKYEQIIGWNMPATNRGLLLKFDLIDNSKPGRDRLRVVVNFEHKQEDPKITDKSISLSEAAMVFYEHYGIINTYIDG
jgi:hypothetical protein